MKKSINELNADLFHPQHEKKPVDPKKARKKGMDFLAIREYGHEELILKSTIYKKLQLREQLENEF